MLQALQIGNSDIFSPTGLHHHARIAACELPNGGCIVADDSAANEDAVAGSDELDVDDGGAANEDAVAGSDELDVEYAHEKHV